MKKLKPPKKKTLSLTFEKLERMARKRGLLPYQIIDEFVNAKLSQA